MKKNLLALSLLTISGLYFLLAAILILVALVTNFPVSYAILISIIVLLIQFLISPFLTDLTMRFFYKAKFGYDLPENIKTYVQEVCNKYNIKYPKIGYIDDGAPNAFTYGRTKKDARLVLTRGIFDLLSEEEVKAVVSHELGHIKHLDMLFMTVANLVPLVLYFIYEMTADSNSNDSDNSKGAAVGLIAYVLYIISNYIVLWLSRTREYYADSFAIEETRNPNALAEALVKIGYGLSTGSKQDDKKNKKVSVSKSNALGIFDSKTSKSLVVGSYDEHVSKDNIKNAMKWEMWNVWAKYYELNSTHPLISKRLIAISNRCNEFNQVPYITFDLQKPESFVDDFFKELFIKLLPVLTMIITCIIALVIGIANTEEQALSFAIIGIGGAITMLISFIPLSYKYKNKNYNETKVSNLLGEVKVSEVTSIPCKLEGKIIGRGNPGCILNEDFVIQDDTGIMLLDYNQPVTFINKLFALFRSPEYFEKIVKVTGWYRRSPVPYVEIKTMEVDGKVKKCYTYQTQIILRIVLLIVFAVVAAISLTK